MKTFSNDYYNTMKEYSNYRNQKHSKSKPIRLELYNLIFDYLQENNYKTLIDYGCGTGAATDYLISKESSWKIEKYDPFQESFNKIQSVSVDCVFSIDVLEHVERENITDVLSHIYKLAEFGIVFCIDLWPAKKQLNDGRNAHVLLQTPDEWESIINDVFFDYTIEYYNIGLPEDARRLKKQKLCVPYEKMYKSRLIAVGKKNEM